MPLKLNLEKDIERNLRDYWEILYKRRIVFGVVFLAAFLVSAFLVIFVVRLKYKSTATVIIAPPSVQIIKDKDVSVQESYDVTNELHAIQSDVIAAKVSAYLKENNERSMNVSPAEIKAMIGISNKPRTNVVEISAISYDRYKSFFVLKAVLVSYVEDAKERRDKMVKDMYNALANQLEQKRKEIEAAESALTKFLLDNEIIASALEVGTSEIETDSAGKTEFKKEPQINEKYLLLKSQKMDKEAFLKEIKDYRKQDDVTALAVIAKREPSMVDLTLRDALYEKERELAKLLVTQSELHPNSIAAKGEVDEARKKITFEVDRAVQSLEISIKTLSAEEDKLRKIIDVGLSSKMVEYNTLKRDLEAKKSIYANFLNELQVINVADKLQNVPFLRVIREPFLPIAPQVSKPMYLIFALLFSLVLSGSVIFVLENINISIERVEEVEEILDLEVLATIPSWKRRQEVAREEGLADAGLVVARHPRSVISEAFRMLKNNIRFINPDKKLQSFVVTSANPQEGKSFVCSNLAIIMAAAGEKIILIDADLRRPSVHKYFNVENKKGLSDYLLGESSIDDIKIQDTAFANLKIVTSGRIPQNPNELLGEKRINELVEKLNRENYIVIIDSPPVLAVSDSLILSAKTGGTILVILASSTTKHSAARAKLLLKNTGSNMLGGVLNGVESTRGGYYYCNHEYYTNET
ncbi:MAG: polysaccharide biosynthesis tyrosine autokinase [Candidatus Omnitrophica bacterium]|nr:polysaccharide biosynthesis tyrosine autokinase [Candidatus Omnitrophota bacterium]